MQIFWAEFNDYNGALFDIRGRALNNVVYWSSQIFGSIGIGLLLDSKHLTRRSRAFAGWVVLFIMVFIVDIWGYFYQKCVRWNFVRDFNVNNVLIIRNYTRASVAPASGYTPIDIHDSKFPARVWLMIFCGLLDSMWQTASYWIMGAMSNDPAKLAYLTGFCECQSKVHVSHYLNFLDPQTRPFSQPAQRVFGARTVSDFREFSNALG